MKKLANKSPIVFFYKSLYAYAMLCAMTAYALVSIGNAKFGPPHASILSKLQAEGYEYIWLWWFIAALLGLFIVWWWASITAKSYQYEVRNDEFYLEYGVFKKEEFLLPYNTIQNVTVGSNSIYAFLGLALITINIRSTGTTNTPTIQIPALDAGQAKILADQILALKSKTP